MLNYKILWKKSAIKEIAKIPKEIALNIYDSISGLKNNPRKKGSRKLRGSEVLYRIRVNEYRVIYSIYDDILVIEIIKIAHRKEVYRSLH
jgi:mRNA interferase RelE/StbE